MTMMKKIKSGNLLPDRMNDIVLPLENAGRLHLNTLNVPLRVDVPDPGSARMELYPHAFNQVEQALPAIRDHNLAVFLEPFPWVQNGALPETAWKPKYEQDWFHNWSKICLQAAWFAQSNGIQTLVISDGISQMEPYPENWLELIHELRKIYSGQITYRTQWWYTSWWNPLSQKNFQQKLKNPLFGALDFISISAYFELTQNSCPDQKEILAAWHNSTRYNRRQHIFQQVKELHEHWRKPIFFGEVGYVDREGTTQQPWNVQPSKRANSRLQKNAFSAFYKVFWPQPWFLGASVFQIHMPESRYYPVGKPAEKIIRDVPWEVD